MTSIDLNADLGEHPGTDLDEHIMPYLSSCNIACGGHIGDEQSVRKAIRLAKAHQVAVGAHPSFPDQANFGRKELNMEPNLLAQSIQEQIELVMRICKEEEVELHHIKPHGALYNLAAKDAFISRLILEVIMEVASDVLWMGLAGSKSQEVATNDNYPFIAEGFADRKYEQNGELRSRAKEGAVLRGQEVLDQVVELAVNHRAWAEDWIELNVQSICLHSDTSGAVTLAKEIHHHLVDKGIQIAAV